MTPSLFFWDHPCDNNWCRHMPPGSLQTGSTYRQYAGSALIPAGPAVFAATPGCPPSRPPGQHGSDSAPVWPALRPDGKYRFLEGTIEKGESPADFSHLHAAVAAGLGEFGLNGLVLTGFGTRNRFNSILINAPLTADAMYDGPRLCRPEVCNRKCVRMCPTRAFDCKRMLTADYGERRFEYRYVKKPRCILGAALGLVKGTGGYSDLELGDDDEITADDVKEALANASVAQKKLLGCVQGIIVGDFCGLCQYGCPAHQWARRECPADSPAHGP